MARPATRSTGRNLIKKPWTRNEVLAELAVIDPLEYERAHQFYLADPHTFALVLKRLNSYCGTLRKTARDFVRMGF